MEHCCGSCARARFHRRDGQPVQFGTAGEAAYDRGNTTTNNQRGIAGDERRQTGGGQRARTPLYAATSETAVLFVRKRP
jgi:hypothetical protein